LMPSGVIARAAASTASRAASSLATPVSWTVLRAGSKERGSGIGRL